jgi:hypothetical protein
MLEFMLSPLSVGIVGCEGRLGHPSDVDIVIGCTIDVGLVRRYTEGNWMSDNVPALKQGLSGV